MLYNRLLTVLPQDLRGLITLSIQVLIILNLIKGRDGCLTTFNLDAQTTALQFSSPNYPNAPYDHNADLCWRITADQPDTLVVAEITDMNIEYSIQCRTDSLSFRDGGSTNSTLLAKLCGATVASFTSSGRTMFIRFITDFSVNDRGFRITFYSVPVENSADSPDGILEPDDMCDRITFLTAMPNYQDILSPDFRMAYRSGLDTCWSIQTEQADDFVRIQVVESTLEFGNPCSLGDYVQVRDGGETTSDLLAEWCGEQLPSFITSTRRAILIRFRTNFQMNDHTGFKIRYWAIESSSSDASNEDGIAFDSTGRVLLGAGILVAFALIVSAIVYHKKYNSKRRANVPTTVTPHTRRHRHHHHHHHNAVVPGAWGSGGRLQMPTGYPGRGGTLIATPAEPGTYPSYSAPTRPAYAPYGAPPMPPGMIIAPPPYSPPDQEGSVPEGTAPPPLAPVMTLNTITPPPCYDDIIKDDQGYPPNYINSEAEYASQRANQSGNSETENTRNRRNSHRQSNRNHRR